MFSFMLSLVKLKLCRVVHQGSVSIVRFYTVFPFRMFELVAAIQICIQTWNTFPMIFTRNLNKIKHRIEHSQNTISSYRIHNESVFPASFLPKTLSRKLDFCLLTLMNFNALEFTADFKNRIFYALNIMY